MSGKLSVSGDDDEWQVFGTTPPNGNEVLFRSRAGNPGDHAIENQIYLIAVVTGEGNRDLFFAARDLDELRSGIEASTSADTIKLQFAPAGEKKAFLKGLSLSAEQTQAAIAQGRVHEVPSPSTGRFFGKLFGH